MLPHIMIATQLFVRDKDIQASEAKLSIQNRLLGLCATNVLRLQSACKLRAKLVQYMAALP